jgi:hypothetical protein
MNFRKINNISGWIVFVLASLVYILTAEMRGSFWDCGEFVSACYKVQLPHPPGAPLFVLLGRFFIILFGDNPMTAAKAVNVMNAFASGATILFLFWTITHFARKLMMGSHEEPNLFQTYAVIGAGVVGAFAYTFTDSFWFSAVEGEVYALSSFFTGLAFWAILKWEHANDLAGNDRTLRNRADRWIIFLFFALGLSIGIHLLGLLVIPAAVMVYYYNRYTYSRKGAIVAFIIGCLLTGLVQVVVIKWSVDLAGRFDIAFVNSFHLPFFSGFAFFFVLLGVLVWLGLRWANKNNWSFLRLGLWCFSFMMLGYSAYLTTMERSNADPSLDMNNVDNPMNLVYYLGREQYGSQPILYGTHFLAQPARDERGYPILKEGKVRYAKGPDSYVELAPDQEYTYDSKDYRLFPRVWDPSNDQSHADYYISWLNLETETVQTNCYVMGVGDGVLQVQDETGQQRKYYYDENFEPAPNVREGAVIYAGQPYAVKIPSYADNIRWFMTYQMGFMYWRYFMWNFSGKQNDIQGGGNRRDGNWISGISAIDNLRLGDQSKMPDSIKHNKEHNAMYLLPFILGIIGCVYQFIKNRQDWIVSFLLFFFTGVAIVVYLNQAGNQPRERDYAFAGSFYAYAIWIGLAVVALVRMARDFVQDQINFKNTVLFTGIATTVIMIMADANAVNFSSFLAALLGGVIASALTAILVYAIRAVSGKGVNLKLSGIVAAVICLVAPIIMGAQEWDDHDRSNKTLAPDIAYDYLAGCPKDAILFTFGDNDTYPLWYAQEVEGVRPDVRIVNTSLLGIDWYVNQLRYKVNESPAFDVVWSEDQLRGFTYAVNSGDKSNSTQPLYQFLKTTLGGAMNGDVRTGIRVAFPSHLTVPVDVNYVKQAGLVKPTDSVLTQVTLDMPPNKSFFSLDQLTMLSILASSNWKRPICFTSPYGEIGFGPYLRQVGLIYQVVPVLTNLSTAQSLGMDVDKSKDLLMNQFRSGNADKPGVYFDEENRRHLLSIRAAYVQAASNLADEGRKQEAVALLDRAETLIHTEALPYAMVSRNNGHNRTSLAYLEAAYKAGHTGLIKKLKDALTKDFNDQLNYYKYLKDKRPEYYAGDLMEDEQFCMRALQQMQAFEKHYNPGSVNITENPGQGTDSSKRKDSSKK